ncbi:MAG: DNA-directed RNA polymerase subunit L [Candidatus Methanogranum gryphiswaldense]|jgi:DNA-directed RNA polymerase subunit L|nr:MAG: DNA-directed RNA polymerase subunit L [Candidatus Methanogranum sp. U3.2.1]
MQTYVVEKTDKSITVGFKDINLTIIAPLIKALDDDKNVEIARFIDKHPELCDRQIYVKVKKGKPEDTLKKAFKTISEYYSDINE